MLPSPLPALVASLRPGDVRGRQDSWYRTPDRTLLEWTAGGRAQTGKRGKFICIFMEQHK